MALQAPFTLFAIWLAFGSAYRSDADNMREGGGVDDGHFRRLAPSLQLRPDPGGGGGAGALAAGTRARFHVGFASCSGRCRYSMIAAQAVHFVVIAPLGADGDGVEAGYRLTERPIRADRQQAPRSPREVASNT